MPVELRRTFVNGVNDDRSCTELVSSPHAPSEGVDQEVTAETLSLFGLVDGEPGQEHDGDGIGHSPPESGGSAVVHHRAHRQHVVADDPVASTENVGRRGTSRAGNPSGVTQPTVEIVDAGGELVEVVGDREPLERPKRLEAHRAGIGLGSAA